MSTPFAQGYGARINDEYVRFAINGENDLRIFTRDSLAPRSDDRGSTIENVLDIGYVFGRTDYSGGEGYDWDPPAVDSLDNERIRDTSFWDSRNVDVSGPKPGEPYLLRLSHAAEQWSSSPSNVVDIGVSANFIYITSGTDVKRYLNWSQVTPSATYTGPSTNLVSLAVAPNDSLMAVDTGGDVWYKSPTGSTLTKIYDTPTDGAKAVAVWYVKARWIVFTYESGIGQLAEMPTTGGAIAGNVFDTMDANVWSVIGSGPAIVAAVADGTIRTYTPANADDASSQGLVPKGRTEMPSGEEPYLLGSNADVLGIMTLSREQNETTFSVRFYQAQVLDARFDYSVGQIQMRREWESVLVSPTYTRAMPASRDELFWTVFEPVIEGGRRSMLWRFDVVTGGLSRHSDLGATSVEMQIGSFDGRFAGIAANTIVIESELYQDEGYLITPNITFGLNTDIAWIAHVFASEFSVGDGSIAELYYTTVPEAITDPTSTDWKIIRRIHSNAAGSSDGEIVLSSVASRTLALMIRLIAGNAQMATPRVSRTAIRGIPTHRDIMVQIPVNVSDYVEVPWRRPIRVPDLGHTLHTRLLELVGRQVELEIYKPPLLFGGVVNNLLEPVRYITPRGSASRMTMLEFRGSILAGSVAPTGNAGLGLGLLGVVTLGIGDTGAEPNEEPED